MVTLKLFSDLIWLAVEWRRYKKTGFVSQYSTSLKYRYFIFLPPLRNCGLYCGARMMCLIVKNQKNSFDTATVTHSCFCDDCCMTTAGAISVSFLLSQHWSAVTSCCFLFSYFCTSHCVSLIPCWSIASHCDPVCVRGRSEYCSLRAALLNHTGFLSCMTRYLISL